MGNRVQHYMLFRTKGAGHQRNVQLPGLKHLLPAVQQIPFSLKACSFMLIDGVGADQHRLYC